MEPVKWQKYLLLVSFGLTRTADLEEQIHRAPWSARMHVFEELSASLPNQEPSAFTVVKLVTPHGIGQLENIRVATQRDLPRLKRTFQQDRSNIAEVWTCRTPIGALLSVAGRIAISTRLEPFGHCVEQVWQCSPRLLESRGPTFKYPYVRATRIGWGRRYHVDEMYLPKGWRRRAETVRREFAESMIALERGRLRLEEFASFIERAGSTSYSFEYKVVANRLSIIDWDTNSDWEILEHARNSGLLSVL